MLNNEGKKVKKFARTRIRTPNLLIQSFFTIAIPSLYDQAPTGSQYSEGPSSGCNCHCLSHQQSNQTHPVAQRSNCLTNKLQQLPSNFISSGDLGQSTIS